MKSAQRTLQIYRQLLQNNSISTVKLAEYYGVDRKTIENSIKVINSIFGEQKVKYNPSSKKWSIEDKSSNLLTKQEVVTLNIIKHAAKERGEEFYNDTIKLLSKFKDNLHNSIFNHINSENIDNIKNDLAITNNAVINREKLSLIYKNKKRVIKPLKLANFDGYWYLIVQDSDNRIKTFYFKDISEIKELNEKFSNVNSNLESRLNSAINAYFTTDVEPYEIKLHIKKDISYIFKRKVISKTQRVLSHYQDGSIDIALFITHDMEIIPTIQQYLPHIYIIEDDANSKRVAKQLKNNLQNYLKEI